MNVPERVRRTVRRYALLGRGGRVLVALSGGPDSVALVHVLGELERDGELTVCGLAHFNHQLRGAEADEDEAFCRALAAERGLRFEAGRADVRALAREQGRSVEDAARVARYAFLEAAADRLGADAIAVGHTRDDQAETFLLRLLRGAGSRGLASILPKSGRVIRPMLDVSRAELRAYAEAHGLRWRTDVSNDDVSIPRNRVRHELIPFLAQSFSPGVVEVLARAAAVAREDDDALHGEAIELARRIVLYRETTGDVEVDAEALMALHPALAARVAQLALRSRAGGVFVGFDHVERFLEFAAGGRPGSMISLPGQRARHRGGRIVLEAEPERGAEGPPVNSFEISLSIPGEVTLERTGWAISAERLPAGDAGEGFRNARGREVVVACGALSFPLAVRGRRPGDRFRPLGLGGRGKKLQDFLVDRKIPSEMRDSLPIVVDGAGRIVWVVGEAVAEDFRVTEPSAGVLLLKARRLGGLG
ncbi:MAG TPA: tRNA lysidine(34) synthetase TilS [Vicinamibacterales bacterium]